MEFDLINRIIVITINAIGFFLLMLVIISDKKFKSKLTKLFIGMSIAMFLWIDFAYLSRTITDYNTSLTFLRIAWIVTPVFVILLYHFTIQLIGVFKHIYIVDLALLAIGSLLTVLGTSGYIVKSISRLNGNINIIYGDGIFLYLVLVFLIVITTIIILFMRYPKLESNLKKQTKYYVIGLFIFYLLNLAFNFILPIFFDISRFYYFGDYSTVVLLSFIAYGIIKHEFLGVKTIFTSLIIGLLTVLLIIDTFTFSENLFIVAIKTLILIIFLIFGYLLINSIVEEISKRGELERLSKILRIQTKDLEVKNIALKYAARRERDMMDIVGHELRTPTTLIKNALANIQLLKRMKKITKKKEDFYIEKAQEATEREIKLINTFLGATKFEGGIMQLDPSRFSIVELAKQVVKENKSRVESKKLKLIFKPHKEAIPVINGDRTRIGEVIDNLISNAIKFTNKGKIEIWCDADDKKKNVTVFVKDTGIGIAKKDQKHLFKKFGRLQKYISEKDRMAQIVRPGGTGLGLFLVKGIVTLHGGEVGMKSKAGKGSTFWFSIPVENKIPEKHLLNPIFKTSNEKDVFKKLGMKR